MNVKIVAVRDLQNIHAKNVNSVAVRYAQMLIHFLTAKAAMSGSVLIAIYDIVVQFIVRNVLERYIALVMVLHVPIVGPVHF
ncbi:MAG: hypothetical protein MUO54_11720 [Anaerolineales bacterium]|nr:hypothetical protein [Anaerolineales bacterium]